MLIILKNKEIELRFIADNGDDFGLRVNMNQNFYEEAILFYQQNSIYE